MLQQLEVTDESRTRYHWVHNSAKQLIWQCALARSTDESLHVFITLPNNA